jgi:outer membrane protein OmpA-like peptidoglycan-associated protein
MKRFIVIIFLCVFPISLHAQDNAGFALEWTVRSAPWFYEPQYKMNNISFNSDVALGYAFGSFSIAAKPFFDYVSLNGIDPARLLQGSWIDLGTSFDCVFRPFTWGEITLGAGGFYQRAKFQYNGSGWLGTNRGGMIFACDLKFIPYTFADFSITNRLDTIFAFDGNRIATLPNYTIGLRANIRPGLDWLEVFAEADAFYLNYTSAIQSVSSWMFEAQIGAAVTFKETGDRKNQDMSKNGKTNDKVEINDSGFDTFAALKPGVEAAFGTIAFENGKDIFLPGALPSLERLASILNAHKSIVISIEAYAEYSGKPASDLELVRSRGQAIKSYLTGKGVDGSHVRVSLMGQVINPKDAQSEKPRIIIKIISI